MGFNLRTFGQLAWLAGLIFASVLSVFEFQNSGVSAVFIIILLLLVACAIKLLSSQGQYNKQLQQILRALANNDPTLGLVRSAPMADKIAEVRQQLQSSRIEAEVQAQFLQSLLLHLDQAVLVVNDANIIIHKNPALDKLLGQLVEDISQLGELGALITSTNKNYRGTINNEIGEHQDVLSVHISCCEIQGKVLKLVSIQSIYQALVIKEQQAYKRLTKVLTHEVANSITPLASLAQTAKSLVPTQLSFEDEEDKQDLYEALATLESRTSHLNVFIKSFHQITALPPPNLSKVDLANLIQQVLLLFNSQVNEQSVNIQFDDDASCLLMADAGQIEQTIINILKNALEAIADSKQKQVKLHLYETTLSSGRQQLLLDIEDTGAGIADHVIEQIFVPFFTTKKNGTGIGLSLSRQIMLQHGGDLQYIKKPKAGGCFRLSFGSF